MKTFNSTKISIGINIAPALVGLMGIYLAAATGFAAGPPKSGGGAPFGGSPGSSGSGSSSGAGSRSFVLTIPVTNMSRDTAFRGEFNFGSTSLGIESGLMGQAEEYPEEKVLITGESMITSGRHVALMLSRFGNPANMSGWFWTLGAGVRTMEGSWRSNPSQLSLRASKKSGVNLVVDDAGKTLHRYTAKGATGHARFGYRWVSQAIPLAIGAHVGVRHFEGKFKDADNLDTDHVALALDEKATLRRRYMTQLEPAVEFGLAF